MCAAHDMVRQKKTETGEQEGCAKSNLIQHANAHHENLQATFCPTILPVVGLSPAYAAAAMLLPTGRSNKFLASPVN